MKHGMCLHVDPAGFEADTRVPDATATRRPFLLNSTRTRKKPRQARSNRGVERDQDESTSDTSQRRSENTLTLQLGIGSILHEPRDVESVEPSSVELPENTTDRPINQRSADHGGLAVAEGVTYSRGPCRSSSEEHGS